MKNTFDTKLDKFVCGSALLSALIIISGCSESASVEKSVLEGLTGRPWSEIKQVVSGKIIDTNIFPFKTWLAAEGYVNGVVVKTNQYDLGDCPESLEFMRTNKGFSFAVSRSEVKHYNIETTKRCVSIAINKLVDSYHQRMAYEEREKLDLKAKATEEKQNIESWN